METGDKVPPFEVTDQRGVTYPFDDLLVDGPVVLFFYPAAFTPGCTKESCHFRDLAADFDALGARRVGISDDPVDRQADFARRHGLDYTLLSDPDRVAAKIFGVRKLGPIKRRATFVIDTDGTVLASIRNDLNMQIHADQALRVLAARAAS